MLAPMQSQGSGQILASGAAWIAAGQVLNALSGLAGSVLSARLLDPGDFGLMGLAMLVINTLQALSQTGFDRALVQHRDAAALVDVAWSVQVLRGFGLACVTLLSAWPLAYFYEKPALIPIVAALSLSLLVQGMRSVSTVMFARELNFRALFTIDAVRALSHVTLVVVLVLTLRNVWALVIPTVASAFVELALSYVMHPHRPRFELQRDKFDQLMRFGKWVSGTSVLALVVTRGDDMFISKYLGTVALGYYLLAFDIANLPATQITHVIGRVSFPTYARLNDEGATEGLRLAFTRVMKATLLLAGPVSVLFWMAIPGVVQHILGDKWQPIIPLVRVLTLAGFVRAVAGLAAGLFHAAGRPSLDFWMNLPRFILLVTLIWPACAYGGLHGVGWLVLLAVSSCLPTWFYGVRSIVGLRAPALLRESGLAAATTVALGASLYVAQQLVPAPTLPLFVAQILAALVLWLSLMFFLGRHTTLRLFDEIGTLVRAIKGKGKGLQVP